MKYQRKPHAVTAQQYDGSFDLDFLEADEHVAAGAPGTTTVVIVADDGDGGERMSAVIGLGEWVVRTSHGLMVLDSEEFFADYEPAQAAGHTFAMNLRPANRAALELMAAVYAGAEAGIEPSRLRYLFEEALTTSDNDALTAGQKQGSADA